MTEITAYLVKTLRERTGAGIMDCKKALIESNGNIILAIENMRKLGSIKAKKKEKELTSNGIIKAKIDGHYGVILEVNCQTDFVARDSSFQYFTEKILNTALNEKINEVNALKIKFEKERISLVTRINENINIRRVSSVTGEIIGGYVHNNMRIGVLVAAQGANEEVVKNIAMHIAASNPEFIKPEDIPTEVLKDEHKIQLAISMKSGKSKEIAEKMIKGRMAKFINEISLINQDFIINPKKTVGQILKENNASVTNFIRFEIGEVEKK